MTRFIDTGRATVPGGATVKLSEGETTVERLRRETTPVAGRPGVRVDRDGREWYSAAWIEPPLRAVR